MPTVAIVTCAELPDLDPDEARVIAPLAALGVTAVPAVWDDPGVDWDVFDLAVLRCPWDYPLRRDEFVAWSATVPRLVNDAATVAWNTDKVYLRELAAAGVTTMDTTWYGPGSDPDLPDSGVWVLKPSIGAGSRDAGRYDLDDDAERALAEAHLRRLLARGRTVMAQPYVSGVDEHGERALIYVDGVFSHAVTKGAMLDGPYSANSDLYRAERIVAASPDEAESAAGAAAMAAIPGATPLYARVDLVRDGDVIRLMELELTEPSLFYEHSASAVDAMAAAIARRL